MLNTMIIYMGLTETEAPTFLLVLENVRSIQILCATLLPAIIGMWPVHSGQADGQNSWETKFHKRVRQSGQMIGLHGHDHESLFGTLGSLIGPLEAPQNDQKPLKMAISGTFKHPSQT